MWSGKNMKNVGGGQLQIGVMMMVFDFAFAEKEGKNPTGAAERLLCFFTVFGRWTSPPFASWRWYKVSTTWSATGSVVRMLADGRNSRTPEGVSSWECGIVKGDKNVLNDLHKKFMHGILVSNINTHKHSVIQRALVYDRSLFSRAR
nr:uncharacterized protein LOC109164944 [Ipomoea batatas]